MTEQELVLRYKEHTDMIELLDTQLKGAKEEREKTVEMLLELMQAEGKDRTASYEGIGYITPVKPDVYASFDEENREAAFEHLRSAGRGDLIKETVHSKSLSSYVKEMLEQSVSVPECIKYFLKPRVRLYAAK